MSDALSLRQALSQTTSESSTIQASASFMMRLYDKSSLLGVSEWRNTLQSCQTDQLLPLLYVANEVLQNSKRNRGNKFLEAFSPVLADSLKFVCERDAGLVEKVRRTTKIWGDRRVFSTRYVGALLKGLDSFRDGGGGGGSSTVQKVSAKVNRPTHDSVKSIRSRQSSTFPMPKSPVSDNSDEFGISGGRDDSDSNDDNMSKSSSDSDDDLFSSGKPSLLNVNNISINNTTSTGTRRRNSSTSPINNNSLKRRRTNNSKDNRSSNHHNSNNNGTKHQTKTNRNTTTTTTTNNNNTNTKKNKKNKKPKKKRPKTLSSDALIQLLDQLHSLQSQHQTISKSSTTATELTARAEDDVAEDALVGEELVTLHTELTDAIRRLRVEERNSHRVTLGRKELEGELKRYIVWGKAGLVADEEEIRLCDEVEEKLVLLEVVHSRAKKEREIKRDKDAKEHAAAEAMARRKEEEEKLKESLAATLRNAEESRPGMVWNQVAREFQYLPDVTEESWRD